MIKEYPKQDCTILDKYLIDNNWKLLPYINTVTNRDISKDYFSTMGLIARIYKKDNECILIGIMIHGISAIQVGYRNRYYYLPTNNCEEYLDDLFNYRLQSIEEILSKKN